MSSAFKERLGVTVFGLAAAVMIAAPIGDQIADLKADFSQVSEQVVSSMSCDISCRGDLMEMFTVAYAPFSSRSCRRKEGDTPKPLELVVKNPNIPDRDHSVDGLKLPERPPFEVSIFDV